MNDTYPTTQSTMKPTLANVKRIAAKHGATVDIRDGRHRAVYIDLPKGRFWKSNGLHVITTMDFDLANHNERDYGYADLIRQMDYGTDECDDPECEHCH